MADLQQADPFANLTAETDPGSASKAVLELPNVVGEAKASPDYFNPAPELIGGATPGAPAFQTTNGSTVEVPRATKAELEIADPFKDLHATTPATVDYERDFGKFSDLVKSPTPESDEILRGIQGSIDAEMGNLGLEQERAQRQANAKMALVDRYSPEAKRRRLMTSLADEGRAKLFAGPESNPLHEEISPAGSTLKGAPLLWNPIKQRYEPQDLLSSVVRSGVNAAIRGTGEAIHGAAALALAHPNIPDVGAAEKMRYLQTSDDPMVAFGRQAPEIAERFAGVDPKNKGVLTTAGENVGSFVPIVAGGPFAPFVMGMQAAGRTIDATYNNLRAKGLPEEDAARESFRDAVAAGLTDQAVWAVLPAPLRSAADKLLIERFGTEGVKGFIMGRVGQAGEGAALGAMTRIAGNTATGHAMFEGVGSSAGGLALLQSFLPRGARPKEGVPDYLRAERDFRKQFEPPRKPTILSDGRTLLTPEEIKENALQITSPETQVSRIGTGGENLPESGGGIRPSEQGAGPAGAGEPTKETPAGETIDLGAQPPPERAPETTVEPVSEPLPETPTAEKPRPAEEGGAITPSAGEEDIGVEGDTGGQPVEFLPEDIPTLRPGERQGDLLSKQTEDLKLVGENAIDFAERKRIEQQSERDRIEYERELQTQFEDLGGHVELIDAINRLGGLPAKGSPHYVAELEHVIDAIRDPMRKAKPGYAIKGLLSRSAKELDNLTTSMRDYGFNFDTPSDLITAVEQRLRTGKPFYGNASSGVIDLPGFGPGAKKKGESEARAAGGAEFSEFGGQNPLALKNADVDQRRAIRGQEPVMRKARLADPDAWDRAMNEIDKDPHAGRRLINRINRGEQESTTRVEQLMILHEQIYLDNERQMEAQRALSKDSSPEEKQVARQKVDDIEHRLLEAEAAGALSGSELGGALRIRQVRVFDDYTLAPALLRAEKTKGGPLTIDERKQVEADVAKVDKAKQDFLDAEEKAQNERAMAILKQVIAENTAKTKAEVAKGKSILTVLESHKDAAMARIRERRKNLSAGVDPTAILDEAIVGAYHLAKFASDKAKWTAAVVKDLGEHVRSYIDDLFERSKEYKTQIERAAQSPEERAGGRPGARSKTEPDLEGFDPELPPEDLTKKKVYDAVASKVEQGMTADQFREIFQQVADDMGEGVTAREIQDIFVDYGKIKYPDPDLDKATLREIRRRGQLASAIADVAEGNRPKGSGFKRDPNSQVVRDMTKQLKNDMREAGFKEEPTEAELKGARDAALTRLRNQIEDLQREIDTGQRPVEQTSRLRYDEELNATRDIRDQLREQVDQLRDIRQTPHEKTVEATERAIKAIERSIEQTTERIKKGQVRKPKGYSWVDKADARLRALQDTKDELNGQLKKMRDALKPPPKSRLERYKAYLDKRIREIEARLKAKNYVKPTRAETELDHEALRKKADLALLQRVMNIHIEDLRLKSQGPVRKAARFAGEGINAVRSIVTSTDLSAVLRQGGFIALSHPVRSAKALPDMFRAFRSERDRALIEQQIHSRANYPLYLQSKLFLSEEGGALSKMEERYMSRWVKHIPVVAASERAYTTFLNRLRADSFDAMLATLAKDPLAPKPEELRAIANYINVVTGRGSLQIGDSSKMAQAAAGLNTLFFAPRFAISRFETLLGQPFYHGTGRTRKMIAAEYARAMIGGAIVLGLGATAGGEIETDPHSSDFGKLRFGNTRIDPFFGLSQASVFLSRMMPGKRFMELIGMPESFAGGQLKRTDTGQMQPKGYPEITFNFLLNKLAPVPGALYDAAAISAGINPPASHAQQILPETLGEFLGGKSVISNLLVPINGQDIVNAMEEQGIARGTALAILSTFGVGVQVQNDRTQNFSPLRGRSGSRSSGSRSKGSR